MSTIQTFTLKVRLKGACAVFAEGFEPGVVAVQEINFPEGIDVNSWPAQNTILRAQQDLLNACVEVYMEVKNENL